MEITGYAEIPVRFDAAAPWKPAPNECRSCGVTLTPGSAGNVAVCDFHDQTCDRCDRDSHHPHGRTRLIPAARRRETRSRNPLPVGFTRSG